MRITQLARNKFNRCSGDEMKDKEFFDIEHLKSNLKGKSVRGGLSTIASEGLTNVLRIGSMIVMARLLVPEDFGLIAMVTALTVFAERFKDLGLDMATVQRREITREQVSTLFWINAGVGAFLMFVVAAFSPLISWFYREPRLVLVTVVLSAGFLFGGLTIQHQALLRRQMSFVRLAGVQLCSVALGAAIGIWCAWEGFGYWALIWKEIATAVFSALGTWLVCWWRPGWPTRKAGVRSMMLFGRDITGFNIVYFFSRNIDQILLGKLWGASPLGLYRQAYQLVAMPMNQLLSSISSVAVPGMSALQGEPGRYRQYYTRMVSMLAFITMPVALYIGIFSDSIVRLVLGDKWIASAEIVKIFAVGAFIQPVASTCGIVMVTLGKTQRYFWWGVASSACLIGAYVIGAMWGAIGVATAYAVASYVIVVPSLWYSYRDTPVSISAFLNAITSAVISSLVTGLILILFQWKTSFLHDSAEILISLFVAIISYCGIWLLLPGGKDSLIEYLSYLGILLKPLRTIVQGGKRD